MAYNFNTSSHNVKNINKLTVADGTILNRHVIQKLSARDQYILDSINQSNSVYDEIFNLVSANSSTNWDNNLASGFNKIYFKTESNNLSRITLAPSWWSSDSVRTIQPSFSADLIALIANDGRVIGIKQA